MILTEKEAASKVCKRNHAVNCLGSRCMGWTWWDDIVRVKDGKVVQVNGNDRNPIGTHKEFKLRRGGCELKL